MSNFDSIQQILSPSMLANASQNKPKAKGGTVAAEGGGGGAGGGSWYEALVAAWGGAMDAQAAKIESLSAALEGVNGTIAAGVDPNATQAEKDAGNLAGKTDQPSVLIQLTGESQKFGFMASSASTSINAVGEGQASLARKG
jgi:hypothetical protein